MSLILDRLPEVRCIVARGSGDIFSSCSIIGQFLHLDAAEPEAHFPWVSDLLTATTRKPVVAAVRGWHWTAILLRRGAGRLRLARNRRGAFALYAATRRDTGHIGGSKAYELALLGQLIGAGEALVLGLGYRVVPPERFEAEVAARISASSWVVVQMRIRALLQAKDTEFHTTRRFMGQIMASNSQTEDAKRRIGAFLDAPGMGGWVASRSVLLPARLALFEERGVAFAGCR